jgi:superfamily I DNA/RNA helicase
MKLTDEQTRALDLFGTSRSLKISAFAGTGKTSTLTALANSTSKSGLYLAFNKAIAAEAKTKFPSSVDCRTTHSIAYRSIPRPYRDITGKLTQSLQGNQVVQLLGIEEIAVGGVTLKPRSLAFLTTKAVQRFCQSGDAKLNSDHVPLSGKLAKIDTRFQEQFREYVADLAAHLWERMSDPKDQAPLGHDGYLKLWSLSKPLLNYDYLFLDEAQDTNEAVLSVLRDQRNHLTLVGDRHQQIYEWRGAVNAMANVHTDAEALLTRSFRFGDAVASAATSILKVLGERASVVGDPSKATKIASTGRTRTTLCRTNAGVVAVVIDALSQGLRPHVVGGVSDLTRMLEDVRKLRRSIPAESAELLGFKDWADVVDFTQSDEGETLRSFAAIVQAHGEENLLGQLASVAREEEGSDLIISTGHKAKGREWDSVALYSDFEPRLDKKDPSKTVLNEEEARLLYVAVTRARQLLVVPPRLAERWNVPVAPMEPSRVRTVPVPPATTHHAKPRPQLPSFAKVVTPLAIAESAPKHVPAQKSPSLQREAEQSSLMSLAQKHSSARTAPENKKPAKGLLASLLSAIMAKR